MLRYKQVCNQVLRVLLKKVWGRCEQTSVIPFTLWSPAAGALHIILSTPKEKENKNQRRVTNDSCLLWAWWPLPLIQAEKTLWNSIQLHPRASFLECTACVHYRLCTPGVPATAVCIQPRKSFTGIGSTSLNPSLRYLFSRKVSFIFSGVHCSFLYTSWILWDSFLFLPGIILAPF